MSAKRKLWETRFDASPDGNRRHSSEAAAYRYVKEQAAAWASGSLRWRHISVYVDLRDGRGWRCNERFDLDELSQLGK